MSVEPSIIIAIIGLALSSSVIVKLIDVVWDKIKSKNGKKTETELLLENTNKLVTEISNDLEKIKDELSACTEANKTLLQDKIYYLCGKIIERNYIYQTESITFNKLFDVYKKRFNGNHIDHLVEQVNKLPIKKDGN